MEATKRTIGIDVDGVLADSVSRWVQEADRRFGVRAAKKDVVQYDLHKLFTSISHEEVVELFRLVWSDYEKIRLEDPAIPSILSRLHNQFRIYIATATSASRRELTKWLEQNGIVYDNLIQLPHHTDKPKLDSVDIYIDDQAEVIEDVARSGRIGILLRQPWNAGLVRDVKDPRIIVAYNWREIEQILLTR